MAIKRLTPNDNFRRYAERKVENLRLSLIEGLKRVGEQAVTEARTNHIYKNQTGNLQSSIGYCIVEDGEVIFGGGFEAGYEGAEKGKAFMERLISEHSTGLVLIVVAGMEYAAYVEAKNLNVLDSSEQLVQRLVPQMLKALNFK